MSHVNQQVREAAKVRLDGIAGLVGVFTNRGPNLDETQLPVAIIATGDDEVEQVSKGGTERRMIPLAVVVVADGDGETVDDDLDTLRSAIETALSDKLGGLAKNMQHTGSELDVGKDEDGQRWFAFQSLSWDVQVWTQEGDPETAL